MRYLIFSIVALIMFFVVGCGPALSLHPLYTEKDVIFNPALVGRWRESNNDEYWIFRQMEDNLYNLTVKFNRSDSLVLEGRLLQLGDYTFMDVTSSEPNGENLIAIPAHVFLRLSLKGDTLGIAYLDDSWLRENSDWIKHELVDDGIILTASTRELQDFVLKHAEDKEAFEMEWCRRQ